ncbi:hypothetical protein DFH06DRAFT_1369971 [Mycena polygramma]|nr:hypothetical protein DFH06DRAFT_1369971 [Mycena polygramma]
MSWIRSVLRQRRGSLRMRDMCIPHSPTISASLGVAELSLFRNDRDRLINTALICSNFWLLRSSRPAEALLPGPSAPILLAHARFFGTPEVDWSGWHLTRIFCGFQILGISELSVGVVWALVLLWSGLYMLLTPTMDDVEKGAPPIVEENDIPESVYTAKSDKDNPEHEAAAAKLWAVYVSEVEKYDRVWWNRSSRPKPI